MERGRRLLSAGLAPLVAALPLLWLLRRELSYFDERSMACCDWAVMEFRAGRALRFDEMVGAYSRYGWSHPGPALFYAYAPLYWLSGRRFAGLSASAVVVNLVCVVLVVVLARRAGGTRAAWAAAATMTGFYWVFGLNELANPWNPPMVILPTTLAALAMAASVQGVRWAPALAVASTSFAVQAHIASAPVMAAMMLATCALLVAEIRSGRWDGDLRHVMVTGSIVAAVMWALPVYEELRPGEGNVEMLVGYFTHTTGSQSSGDVVRNLGDQLTLSVRSMGNYLNPTLSLPNFGPTRWAVAGAQVVMLGATVIVGRRRREVFASSLAIVSVAGAAAAIVSAFRAVDQLYPYLTTTAIGVGLALWMSIALSAANPIASALSGRFKGAMRVVAPLVVGLLGIFSTKAAVDTSYAQQRDGQGLRRVEEAVRGVVAEDDVVFVEFEQEDWEAVATAVASLDGQATVIVPEAMEFMFGPNPAADSVDLCIYMHRSDDRSPGQDREVLWYGQPVGTFHALVEVGRGPTCDAAYAYDRSATEEG